jgi:putative ABC transport system substrate-binding protein
MKRREFMASIGGAVAAWPLAARSQPARRVARVGILGSADVTSNMTGLQPLSPTVTALLRGLGELGYVYGRDFVTEPRGGESKPERWPSLAAELVGLQPDVIVAAGPMLPALKQATSAIPVVMTGSIDPVGQGFVQSLRQPGGNFTGLSLQLAETTGKRLELLKEVVPSAASVAVLWDSLSRLSWQAAEVAAEERGSRLQPLELRDAGELEGAFKAATEARAGALLVFASAILIRSAHRVVELAAKSRLPAMYELRLYVDAGGLISYSANLNENWRRAAVFVDKILKGTKPADLPVEQPTKFELVVNLRTAKALGLTIPQSIVLRADEVIE